MDRQLFINDSRHSSEEELEEDDDYCIEDDPFSQWTDLTTNYSGSLGLEALERTGLAIEPVRLEKAMDKYQRVCRALRFRWTPTLPASSARIFALICDTNWNISVAFDTTIPRNDFSGYVVLESTDLGANPEWVLTEEEEELHIVYCVLQPGHSAVVAQVDFLNYLDNYEFDVGDLVSLFEACWLQNGADIFLYSLTVEEALEVAKSYGWQ